MAKQTRIGLGLFFNNGTNSGIVNYIYNIVAALNTLPDSEKPKLVLLHNNTAETSLIQQIGYPGIIFINVKTLPDNYFERKLNSVLYKITGKNYYLQKTVYDRIDCFYPYFPFVNFNLSNAPNKIEWLVDFNNRTFPDFYEDGGNAMQEYQAALTKTNAKIVLSSNTLLGELKQYYPDYKNDVKILRFACSLPSLSNISEVAIKQKHKIEGEYFMSPNQFWEHKNQMVVLKAIHSIKQKQPDLKFKVLFTGSLAVSRGKGLYADKLKEAIESFGVANYVKFLGVLDRKEQLVLMKGSVALVQPSLYEGWSTLVEEAKALNKFIILSDLPVHREQINNNCHFFSPMDSNALAQSIVNCIENKPLVTGVDYNQNIQQYGRDILAALN